MPYNAEIFTSSIIVVGDFNPAIFSPDWLERNRLIGADDADTVRHPAEGKSLLVSHQATTFETKWFALQVIEDQFSLTSKSGLSPAFKDLAVGIFQLVLHTPVRGVGLNFFGHFKVPTQDEFYRVGDVLAPKAIWQELYPAETIGLADVTIHVYKEPRGEPRKSGDQKRISVQSSRQVKSGIFMQYNNHHDVVASNTETAGERTAKIIDLEWESSWRDALRVFDTVLTKTIGK